MRIAGAALVLIASTGFGCASDAGTPDRSDGPARAPAATKVVTAGNAYRPGRVRVLVGGTVTWINRDAREYHTAETQPRESPRTPWQEESDFDTHTLTWGEPYSVTFHKPGAFAYYCSFHPTMKGTVEVVTRTPPG